MTRNWLKSGAIFFYVKVVFVLFFPTDRDGKKKISGPDGAICF